jgi:hypothetical protein
LDIKDYYQCLHLGSRAIKDESVIKFGLNAYKHPAQYLDTVEDKTTVNQYERFLTDSSGTEVNYYFKSGIKESFEFTDSLNKLWTIRDSIEFRKEVDWNILWRYGATPNGIFRILPGNFLYLFLLT